MRAGDILILNPLTIHTTAASTTGKPRRVLHIAYASAQS
jgi:ectoine hydroxylase-related dioxygenase (phytanoyl-CoA dioxygenase family)